MIAAALAAGLAVALAYDLPLRLNIVAAAATGIAVGLFFERKKSMTLWLTLLGMTVVTFVLRASPRRRCSPRSGHPKCWCKMNNCPPALSQLLWRGAGA